MTLEPNTLNFTDIVNRYHALPNIDSSQIEELHSSLEKADFATIILEQPVAQKLHEVVLKASSNIDKDSPIRASLEKVDAFTLGPRLSKITNFLNNLLTDEAGINAAIAQIQNDHLEGTYQLRDFLKEKMGPLPAVDEELIKKDAAYALLVLVLNQNPEEDHLREMAAKAYAEQYPEDEKFEKNYAWFNSPIPLLGHFLLLTNKWKSVNPENKGFYDDRMFGFVAGTQVFDKGEKISPTQLALIAEREKRSAASITGKLKPTEDGYEVTGWCSTAPMATDKFWSNLYIPSRWAALDSAVSGYFEKLQNSSDLLKERLGVADGTAMLLAVSGSYCSGKATCIQKTYGEDITYFSVETLNDLIKTPDEERKDHHFEAVAVKNKFQHNLSKIQVVVIKAAAIDWRFGNMINNEYVSRDKIRFLEIASNNFDVILQRLKQREPGASATRIQQVRRSFDDAQKNRKGRIETSEKNSKVELTLVDENFNPIANVKDGKRTITEGQEDLFNQLIS